MIVKGTFVINWNAEELLIRAIYDFGISSSNSDCIITTLPRSQKMTFICIQSHEAVGKPFWNYTTVMQDRRELFEVQGQNDELRPPASGASRKFFDRPLYIGFKCISEHCLLSKCRNSPIMRPLRPRGPGAKPTSCILQALISGRDCFITWIVLYIHILNKQCNIIDLDVK